MTCLEQLYDGYRPGWTLPGPFYTDRDLFEAEAKSIFGRHWLFAGHSCQIPRPGDYFTYQAGGDPIIVIRADDGGINALHNTCRHRGSRLCAHGAGYARRLVCPYHNWTYDGNGALLSAPNLGPAFQKSDFGLHRAHAREVAGLIFVCAAHSPPDFAAAAAELSGLLDPHGLAVGKIAHSETYELAANWKLVIENHRECYHCPNAHREYARIHFDTRLKSAAWKDRIAARTEACRQRLAAMGIDGGNINPTSAFTGQWWRANRTAFPEGYVTESPDGQPVAPLMGQFTEADVGTARAGTYPNFWLHATSDHATTMQVIPLAPDRTLMRADWLVRADAVEGVDYQVDRLIAFTDRVNREDRDLILGQAAGIRSSRYGPGPLMEDDEARVRHFLDWYMRQMTAPQLQAAS